LTRGPTSRPAPRIEVELANGGERSASRLPSLAWPGLRPTTPNDRIGHSIPTLEKMGYNPTMPYARIIPALVVACLAPLVALAQAPSPPPPAAPEGPTPAENHLTEATIKVRLMERIAAKVDQEVDMLNQKFNLVGNYYKDTDHRIRLQLKLVGLADSGSDMLQVCDGKVLWDYQQALGMRICRKRELLPILKKLEDPNIERDFRSLIISQLGFGGPEAMMMGLKNAVKFDQLAPDKLDVDGTVVDVLVLGGSWIDRSRLMGPNDRPLAPTAPLPPYIPSNVRIFIGKDNGWPYKIEMKGNAPSLLQEDTRAIDPTSGRPVGRPVKPPKVDPSKITLLYKLLPPSEIKSAQFFFQPPADLSAGSVVDETEQFIAQLDLYIQREVDRKKAEAAKKGEDEPLLKAPPIDVKSDPGVGGIGTIPPAEPPLPK
jgi:hypothetical protein